MSAAREPRIVAAALDRLTGASANLSRCESDHARREYQAARAECAMLMVEAPKRGATQIARELRDALAGILADVDAPGHTIRSIRAESIIAARAAYKKATAP